MTKKTEKLDEKLMPLLDAVWMLRWGVKSSDETIQKRLGGEKFIAQLEEIVAALQQLVYKGEGVDKVAANINSWVECFAVAIDRLPHDTQYHTTIKTKQEFNLNKIMSADDRTDMYVEIFRNIQDNLHLYVLKAHCLEIAIEEHSITDEQIAKEKAKLTEFKKNLAASHRVLTDRLAFITNLNGNRQSKQDFQKKHAQERQFLNNKLNQIENIALEDKVITYSEYFSLPTREIAADSEKQLHNQLAVDKNKLTFIRDFIDHDLRELVVTTSDVENKKHTRPRLGSWH